MMISQTIKFVLTFLTAYSFAAVSSASSASSFTSDPLLGYEKVRVHRCDEENQKIPTLIDVPLESLEDGLRIRLCFESSPQASFNDISILKVVDFTFTKTRTPGDLAAAGPTRQIPAIIRQKTVDNGVVVSDNISTLSCDPGSEICVFQTTLTGFFFLTEGTIHGKGNVLMQRGNKGGRRQLQHIDTFENIIIDFDFVGENGEKLPPKHGIMIGIIAAVVILSCCCCSILACFGLRICCFNNRGKKKKDIGYDDYDYDYDVDDVEAPVMMNWMSKHSKRSKKSKKDEFSTYDDDEISETHSLDEDEFWVEHCNEDYEDRREDNYKKEKFSTKTKAAAKPSSSPKSPKKKVKSRSITETKVVRKPSSSPKSPKKKVKSRSITEKTIEKEVNLDRNEDNTETKVVRKPSSSPKSPKKKVKSRSITEKTIEKEVNLDRNEDNTETKVVRKPSSSPKSPKKKVKSRSISEKNASR
jgi:hypothetical protein